MSKSYPVARAFAVTKFALSCPLLGCLMLAGPAAAQSPTAETQTPAAKTQAPAAKTQLAAILMQDEISELPRDNTGFFSAARKVTLKLDTLGPDDGSMEDALVTVVRPDGETSEFTPDADGKVIIDEVSPGPHAIVASGNDIHGTTLHYYEASPEGDDLALEGGPDPVQMTLLRIRENELRTAIDQIGDIDGDAASVASTMKSGQRFNYRVNLSEGGTLVGRIILATDQSISPSGVNVGVFYNGDLVASAVSDARGMFTVSGLRSGIHGLIASGDVGYSAFAFNASMATDVAQTGTTGETFVAAAAQTSDTLPVVMVPPQMVEPVVTAVRDYYPRMRRPRDEAAVAPMVSTPGAPIGPTVGGFTPGVGGAPLGGAPAAGGGFSGGGGGFGGGGMGGGGGLLGGGGGLAGLAGLGAIGAVAATSDDDNEAISQPPVASPAFPSN